MKKKIFALISILVMLSSFLFACGDSLKPHSLTGKQDTSYAVHSNGGTAVQYGDYIYYVNGFSSYTNTDGKLNSWGEVQKNALYRTKLLGSAKTVPNASKEFNISIDNNTLLEFDSVKGKDYDDKEIDIVKTERFASKVIGTSGYANGGIYIYDDYVYYASPSNRKDSTGKVEDTKTEFLRTKVDGTDTKSLYISSSETATSPYAFYKQDGKVYLTVLDGKNIVSVIVSDKKQEPKTIAKDVTSVIFPTISTYRKEDKTNRLEDFIYFTRAVDEDDTQKAGNVVEMMRPSGAHRTEIFMTGTETKLEAVRDGLLFYRATRSTGEVEINFTNLHAIMADTELNINPDYDKAASSNVSGTVIKDVGAFTTLYPFRPMPLSNVAYCIAIDATSMYLFESGKLEAKLIYNGASTFQAVYDNYVYFLDGASLYCTALYKDVASKTDAEKKIKVSDKEIVDNGFKVDFVAGYATFISKVDEWASNYTFFKKAIPMQESLDTFIGEKIKGDLKPKDDENKDENKDEDKTEDPKQSASYVTM